jgi:copper chaperone CopZ
MRSLVLALSLVALSASASVSAYTYQARIEGMVCAYCAYNVGKTIAALPGVDAESVTVNLDSNLADFHATVPGDRDAVSAAFAESGFTMSALSQIDSPATPATTYGSTPLIELDLDGADTARFESILETMGDFASTQRLRLVIEAPEAVEIDLLLPILMGRDHAISVLFMPIEENIIRLRMYSEVLAAAQ